MAYALGHSDFELKRLDRQAQLLRPATREFLEAAGMTAGMRVLDVGSGTGDVAFLAADIVGPSGEVVGTDPPQSPRRAMQPRCKGKRRSPFAKAIRQKWRSISRSISSSVASFSIISPTRPDAAQASRSSQTRGCSSFS